MQCLVGSSDRQLCTSLQGPLEIMVISILYPDFLDPLCLVAVLISIFEMYNVGIGCENLAQ
ncbi:hypothetical protein Syun_000891 [Stephania yunnanensis]|uniref:Uncharacterized protein n=1 Tax=Stephania yunnanensis TaxID=152371 RepID=A0AAP0LD29_9MAGN